MANPGEKVCPECGYEYLQTALRCDDCDVDLVHPEELRGPEELPPASELVAVRLAGIGWTRAFSQALSDAGIPHRIDAPPNSGEDASRVKRKAHDATVAIYVRPEDRDAALEADAAFSRQQLPDLDAPVQSGDTEDCPACGAALREDASECPDCGLFVGETR